MADTEDKKKAKEAKKAKKLAKKQAKKGKNTDNTANENEAQKSDKETSGSGILQRIIMAVVVLVCAGAGLGLGRLFAGHGQPQIPESTPQETEPAATTTPKKPSPKTPAENSKGYWYYNELEPVAANLNVPNATRYVRATLTLELSSELDEVKGRKLLDAKKPALKNRLTLYLASLNIEDCTGTKNLMRIRSEILDAFNQELFPDSKPQIREIYLKEFVIQ